MGSESKGFGAASREAARPQGQAGVGATPFGKARPILFSGSMICALLAGTKTQTRRAIKLPTKTKTGGAIYERPDMGGWVGDRIGGPGVCDRHGHAFPEQACIWHQTCGAVALCPYGVPGDLLWVRESGELIRDAYDNDPATGQDLWRDVGWVHSADAAVVEKPRPFNLAPLTDWIGDCARIGRPSIHMPRWASRLTLEITDVRVERLQDISEDDARAEGCERAITFGDLIDHQSTSNASYRLGYSALWDDINGEGAWDANPWVWAVSFKVHRQNVDALLSPTQPSNSRAEAGTP